MVVYEQISEYSSKGGGEVRGRPASSGCQSLAGDGAARRCVCFVADAAPTELIDQSEALGMAARKVSPAAEGIKDVEADDTKAETVPLGPMPHAPTLHHLATREPTSFHQTTIYYGLVRRDTPPRRKYGLLAASIGIVFLQCFVATGLSTGIYYFTCTEHSDCTSRGTFCDSGICDWCYARHESACCTTNSTDTCWLDGLDREGMCAACTGREGWETFQDVLKDRVDSMLIQDWVTLFLASLVVSFALFAEIRDCMLCEIALREISKRREVPRGWGYAIRGLNFARYFLLLPSIVMSVVALVHNDGGAVKHVCLNTVAVLFLLEIDNMAFSHGLGERTRMEAEEHVHSGARVTEDDLQTMGLVKLICVVLIPCAIFGGVCGYSLNASDPDSCGIMLAPLPAIVVVFVQRMKARGLKLKETCCGIGWGFAEWFLYIVWAHLLYILLFFQAHGERMFDDD